MRIVELALDQEAPSAVLEWAGRRLCTSTGAPASQCGGRNCRAARDLATALAQAHRLGLAHGRLGPDQVLLTDTGRVSFDFSGASVGFPRPATGSVPPGESDAFDEAASLAAVGKNLFDLGVLMAGLDRGCDDSPRGKSRLAALPGADGR